MALLQIDIDPTVKDQTFTVELDASTFVFRLQYNRRDGTWYANIATDDGTPLRSGVRITSDWILFRDLTGQTRPSGNLWILDARSGSAIQAPGTDDLGTEVTLHYDEAA